MNWQGTTAVVTGGTGFIGSFMVERLLKEGASVRVPTRRADHGFLEHVAHRIDWRMGDLSDSAFCESLIDGADLLFHLASYRKNVALHRAEPATVLARNLEMTLALAGAAQSYPLWTVCMSTALAPSVIDLSALASAEAIDGYGLGKALCEAQWIAASHEFGLPLLIPRPVGVYGPRDRFAEDGNVIPALMVRSAAARGSLSVWGDGTAVRQFLFVEDAVEAVFRLLVADATGIQLLVPDGKTTMAELARMIVDLNQPGLELAFDPAKPSASLVFAPDTRHPALADMRWTPLAEGLRRTAEWWRENAA